MQAYSRFVASTTGCHCMMQANMRLRSARSQPSIQRNLRSVKTPGISNKHVKAFKPSAAADKAFVGAPFLQQKGAAGLPKLPPRTAAAAEGASSGATGNDKVVLGSTIRTWKKVIPLLFMFFCILFNYTILRDTKDVLVVTAPGSGAEIIPFLKTWVNLPLAILFTIGYAAAANVLNIQQLFYGFIIPFITFFGAFAYIIYPNASALHPTDWCINLLDKYGDRFLGPLAIIRNWTFCLFYVMAELWGSVVVSVLFWGFANTIMTVKEAKQFYPFFGLGANVALIFSGQAVRHFSNVRATLPAGVDGWEVSLRGMMGLVVAFGLLICALRYYLQKTTIEAPDAVLPTTTKKKKSKPNMGVGESFAFLAGSTYIRCMATLVVCYGIAINIVEVTWKSKLKAQYPNPNDYSTFMGNFSTVTGITTFCLMLLSRWIFAKKTWGFAAIITPLMLGGTGLLFFSLLLFGGSIEPLLNSWSITPLFAAVLVGAAQNIFSKGAKYSLFDPCKEMAYIPLDEEVKTKGKAAIDVICNPLGKSGGALIQQGLILGFGSLAASTPYLGVILLVIIAAWIQAASTLGTEFSALQKQRAEEEIRDAGPGGATA